MYFHCTEGVSLALALGQQLWERITAEPPKQLEKPGEDFERRPDGKWEAPLWRDAAQVSKFFCHFLSSLHLRVKLFSCFVHAQEAGKGSLGVIRLGLNI